MTQSRQRRFAPVTMIQVQEEYIARISQPRIGPRDERRQRKAAGRAAREHLERFGYTTEQARQIIRDAYEMYELRHAAETNESGEGDQ